jgi:hypothetical protein
MTPKETRIFVPKLIGEVSDTSRFAQFVHLDSFLSSEKHNNGAELRMKRNLG